MFRESNVRGARRSPRVGEDANTDVRQGTNRVGEVSGCDELFNSKLRVKLNLGNFRVLLPVSVRFSRMCL